MKINVRIDDNSMVHTRVTIFIDGKNCGQLTLGSADVDAFVKLLDLSLIDALRQANSEKDKVIEKVITENVSLAERVIDLERKVN
jgi:hypothetical protein